MDGSIGWWWEWGCRVVVVAGCRVVTGCRVVMWTGV